MRLDYDRVRLKLSGMCLPLDALNESDESETVFDLVEGGMFLRVCWAGGDSLMTIRCWDGGCSESWWKRARRGKMEDERVLGDCVH